MYPNLTNGEPGRDDWPGNTNRLAFKHIWCLFLLAEKEQYVGSGDQGVIITLDLAVGLRKKSFFRLGLASNDVIMAPLYLKILNRIKYVKNVPLWTKK